MPKRGRLSKDEQSYIVAAAKAGDTPEAIASHLDRPYETVLDYIKLNVRAARPQPKPAAPAADEVYEIRAGLRDSERWKRLKLELSAEELRFFEEEFVKLMTQFRAEGVLATEEAQLFDLIRLDVLKSRNMVERRRALDAVAECEKKQQRILAPAKGDPRRLDEEQRSELLRLETLANSARKDESDLNNDYVKLQDRYVKLMESLKGTRDQRVKEIENAKVNFLGVIKMLQDREAQEREGRQMALMGMAGQKEYERLGRPHRYEDGLEDSPILSCDTVDLGPGEEGR